MLLALGATVTRRTRLEATGQWALEFPALDRLKFVALLRGTIWLIVPGQDAQPMSAGDVCLIGRTTYAVASDPTLPPLDGRALYDGRDAVRLGGDETIVLGGSVTFSPGNADFLLDTLPGFLLVPRSSTASGAVTTILTLLNGEMERAAMGSEIVSARLADVLLVEAIRAYAEGARASRPDGLAHSRTQGSAACSAPFMEMLPGHGRWRNSPVWPACREQPSRQRSPAKWDSRRSAMCGRGALLSLMRRWPVAMLT